jgi:pimeloyl-ACP methyl ester carboxylesterase
MTVSGLAQELVVDRDDATLAGSLWLPAGDEPRAIVLMHPGSGPSDRDNDVYFPPIRAQLLELGLAVSSFDKRGVGGSTGDWRDAGVVAQAEDVVACLAHVRALRPDTPLALFGHSQGGWVVVEAAVRRPNPSFVIANSGPGVTPADQERFATGRRLAEFATTPAEFADAARCFELVLTCMRNGVPFADLADIVDDAGLGPTLARTEWFSFLPGDEAVWAFASTMIDHDPRPALRRLRVPLLALLGADDPVVPVPESVVAYRASVPADLLTVAVLASGDHRLQHGNPPELVDDYLLTLTSFVERALANS